MNRNKDLFDKLDNLAELDFRRVVGQCSLLVENDAKMKAPVDTGALRRSIYSTVEQVEPMHYKGIIGPPDGMDYAVYQEWGTGLFAEQGNGRQTPWSYQTADGRWHTTVGNHPQPFLRPALDENRDRIMRTLEDYINGAMEE